MCAFLASALPASASVNLPYVFFLFSSILFTYCTDQESVLYYSINHVSGRQLVNQPAVVVAEPVSVYAPAISSPGEFA